MGNGGFNFEVQLVPFNNHVRAKSRERVGQHYQSAYAESVRKFQPRVCFETLGTLLPIDERRNSEGVASWFDIRNTVATPSELRQKTNACSIPGFQSKHFHPTRAARAGAPAWAGICERFQRLVTKLETGAPKAFKNQATPELQSVALPN
jgi:hypothetical protein